MLETADFIKIASSAALFIAVYLTFGRLVARRFIAVIAEREARTVGDEQAAVVNRDRARSTVGQIDEQLRLARLEGIRRRDERVSRAREAAQSIMLDAEGKATDSLTRARAEIERLKADALRDVELEAERFAELIARKAVETTAKPMVH